MFRILNILIAFSFLTPAFADAKKRRKRVNSAPVESQVSSGTSSFKHNRAYGQYLMVNADGTSDTLSGFGIGGNKVIELSEMTIRADAAYETYSKGGASISYLWLGGNYVHNIDRQMDALFGLGFANAKVDLGGAYGSASDTEIFLRGGIAYRFSNEIQAEGSLTLIDGDMWISFGGSYMFTREISGDFYYDIVDGGNRIRLGGTYYF